MQCKSGAGTYQNDQVLSRMTYQDLDASSYFFSAHSTTIFSIQPPFTGPNKTNKTVAGIRMRGMHLNAWRYEWFPISVNDGPINIVGKGLFATFYWEAHSAHAFVEDLPDGHTRVLHLSIMDNLPWDINTYTFPIGRNTSLVSFRYINPQFCHLVFSDGVVKYWNTFTPSLPPALFGTYIKPDSTSSLLTTVPGTEVPAQAQVENLLHLRQLEKHSYPPADPARPVYLGGTDPPEGESHCPEGMYHVAVLHRCKFVPPGTRVIPPVIGGIQYCHETSFCPIGASESRDYQLLIGYKEQGLLHPSILPFLYGNSTIFSSMDPNAPYRVVRTPYYMEPEFHPTLQYVEKEGGSNWEVLYPRHQRFPVEGDRPTTRSDVIVQQQQPKVRVPLPWQAFSASSAGAKLRKLVAGLFRGTRSTQGVEQNKETDTLDTSMLPGTVEETLEGDDFPFEKEYFVHTSEKLATVLKTEALPQSPLANAQTPTLPAMDAAAAFVSATSGQGKSTAPLAPRLALTQHFGSWGDGHKYVYGEKYEQDIPSHRTLSRKLTLVSKILLWCVPVLFLLGLVVKPVEKPVPPNTRFWKRNWLPLLWRLRTDLMLLLLYSFLLLTLLAWYLETFPVLQGPEPVEPHPKHIVRRPVTAHPVVPGVEVGEYHPEPDTGVMGPPIGRVGEGSVPWQDDSGGSGGGGGNGERNWEWAEATKDMYDPWEIGLEWDVGFTSTKFIEDPEEYQPTVELYYVLPPEPNEDLFAKWEAPEHEEETASTHRQLDSTEGEEPKANRQLASKAGTLPLEFWDTLSIGTLSLSVSSNNRFVEKPPAPRPSPSATPVPQAEDETTEEEPPPPPPPVDFVTPHVISFRASITAGKLYELEQEFAKRLRLWKSSKKPIQPRKTQRMISALPVDAVPSLLFRFQSAKPICPKYMNHTVTIALPRNEKSAVRMSDANSVLLAYPPVSGAHSSPGFVWNIPHLVSPTTRVAFAALDETKKKTRVHPWVTVYPSLDALVNLLAPTRFYSDADDRGTMVEPGFLCETEFAVHVPLHLSAQQVVLAPEE